MFRFFESTDVADRDYGVIVRGNDCNGNGKTAEEILSQRVLIEVFFVSLEIRKVRHDSFGKSHACPHLQDAAKIIFVGEKQLLLPQRTFPFVEEVIPVDGATLIDGQRGFVGIEGGTHGDDLSQIWNLGERVPHRYTQCEIPP